MRWPVLVGSMLAVAACTSVNPAYESTSGTHEGGPTAGGGGTTEPTQGSTPGEATDGTDPDVTTVDESGGSTSGDGPWLPEDHCRFDLYAINDDGELWMLDPDAGDAHLVVLDQRLASWAIATDPATGWLYVNELVSPNTMWRVDPFNDEIDAEPLEIVADALEVVARATIREGSVLWVGTEQTHRFVWLPIAGGSIEEATLEPFNRGGDMVFLDGDCAVVPALDGVLYRVCFPAPGGVLPTIPVTGLRAGHQFNGIALDATGRLWLSNAEPYPQLVRVDWSEEPWVADPPIDYEITMNDLATVIHSSGC